VVLKQQDIDKIVKSVKQEPCTIQDLSRLIKRSWVTTNSYVNQIKESTGLIKIKTFRKGTQGAIKVVFYDHSDSPIGDDIKEKLFIQISNSRIKTDFDFFEVFQFIDDKKKKIFFEEYKDENVSIVQDVIPFLRQAEKTIHIFSGNVSFINMTEKGIKIIDVIEELLKRKVQIKILCRINITSLNNLAKLSKLFKKYPEYVEVRHIYQPLRGYIVDDKVARFKNEEVLKDYKPGELNKNIKIFYEIYDEAWVTWLQNVFWRLWRTSIDYDTRYEQFKKFL